MIHRVLLRAALSAAVAFVLVGSNTRAATLAVLPDASIQAQVDLAQPGDIVAIFGGTYIQDVTINKAIRLVETDGQDVTITGNVNFTGVTNAPPFEGFTVGSSGKGTTVTNTTGLVIRNVDARPGFGIKVVGNSKVGVIGGFASRIEQDGGELTLTRTEVTGDVATTINSLKTVVFRTTSGASFSLKSKKTWVGYSTARTLWFDAPASTLVSVGNSLIGVNGYSAVVLLSGDNSRFVVANCNVKGNLYGAVGGVGNWNTYGDGAIRIYPATARAVLINNYIALTESSNYGYMDVSPGWQGAAVYSSTANCTVANTIMRGTWTGVYGPYGMNCRNNFNYGIKSSFYIGGTVQFDSKSGDPLFVAGQLPKLQPASPCVDAGINDPIYNDLNGSRNDIGPGGGALFDPDGWTTDNPVVISFDLAPEQLLKGVDTQITVSSGQAVSQP